MILLNGPITNPWGMPALRTLGSVQTFDSDNLLPISEVGLGFKPLFGLRRCQNKL